MNRLTDRFERRHLLVAGGLVAIVALVVLVMAVAGIGPFGGALTKEEFAAQGDEICRQARDEFIQRQQAPPRTSQEAADLANALVGISQQELDAIRELDEPDEVQPALDEYLKAREEGIALIQEGADAAAKGDSAGYAKAQQQLADGQAKRAKLAEAVGFSECSRPITSTDVGQAPSTPSGG
jgi:hypothetical protein